MHGAMLLCLGTKVCPHCRLTRVCILMAFAVTCSCRHPLQPGMKIEFERDRPAHLQTGPSILRIKLLDIRNEPVSDAHVSVEADMSHPGMAPVFGKVVMAGHGTYNTTINFTMPGDWTLLVTAVRADGARVEKQQSVTIEPK
jgi:YtkA-like